MGNTLQSIECDEGKTWNSDSGECVDKTVCTGKEVKIDTCFKENCKAFQIPNYSSGKCVDVSKCGPGTQRNETTGECDRIQCEQGKEFVGGSCKPIPTWKATGCEQDMSWWEWRTTDKSKNTSALCKSACNSDASCRAFLFNDKSNSCTLASSSCTRGKALYEGGMKNATV
jgi:hypothetical protein